MNIVVIPDIHEARNLDKVEEVIVRENPDLTVFLGDYFDQFGDKPKHAAATAAWLKDSLSQPRRVHLFGNHDLPYYLPANHLTGCPGWTAEKYVAVKQHMKEDDWKKLKLHHWEGKWLFTHAGWHAAYAGGNKTLEDNVAFLNRKIDLAWKFLFNSSVPGITAEQVEERRASWVWKVGATRGDDLDGMPGGLLWCDVSEFAAVKGVNQVFGHTPGNLRRLAGDNADHQNWVIDTNLGRGVVNYLVIQNDHVEVKTIEAYPGPTLREEDSAANMQAMFRAIMGYEKQEKSDRIVLPAVSKKMRKKIAKGEDVKVPPVKRVSTKQKKLPPYTVS